MPTYQYQEEEGKYLGKELLTIWSPRIFRTTTTRNELESRFCIVQPCLHDREYLSSTTGLNATYKIKSMIKSVEAAMLTTIAPMPHLGSSL